MIIFPVDLAQNTYAFKKEFRPLPGNQIVEANFAKLVNDRSVKDAKLEIAADKSKVYLTGELVRAVRNSPPTSWHAEVILVEEAKSATETKTCDPVVVTLNLPTGGRRP